MRIILLGFCLLGHLGCLTTAETVSINPPKRLVLALDGISFKIFKKMQDGSYFRNFNSPKKMIATFPSISDPNWAHIVNAPLEKSYTKAHFEQTVNEDGSFGKPVGSLLDHIKKMPAYEKGFDYKPEGILENMATVTWIETTALYGLDAISKEIFLTKGKDTYFAFIMNTDFISHLAGEDGVLKYLSVVDKKIKELQKKYKTTYGSELEVVIVSDHGNEYVNAKMIEYQPVLEKLKWNLTDSLQHPNDVSFVVPEILGFAALYTKPESRIKLAKDFSFIEGVHVSATLEKKNVIRVFSENAENELKLIFDPESKTLVYKVEKGKDPFDHKKLIKKRTVTYDKYFNLTVDSAFPYAAVRIWEGFYKNSIEPATVLVSAKKAYAFGNPMLRIVTKIRGLTSLHGSLALDSSAGVVVSTHREFKHIRPYEFKNFVELRDFGRPPKK